MQSLTRNLTLMNVYPSLSMMIKVRSNVDLDIEMYKISHASCSEDTKLFEVERRFYNGSFAVDFTTRPRDIVRKLNNTSNIERVWLECDGREVPDLILNVLNETTIKTI